MLTILFYDPKKLVLIKEILLIKDKVMIVGATLIDVLFEPSINAYTLYRLSVNIL